MARKKQQTTLEQKDTDVSSDRGLFAGEPAIQPEGAEHEIFDGGEYSYETLADSVQSTTTQQSTVQHQPSLKSIQHRRFSTVQKILFVSIVLIAAMLLYGLLNPPSRPASKPAMIPANQGEPAGGQTSAPQKAPRPEVVVWNSTQKEQPQIKESNAALSPAEPLSLKVAQDFYLQRNFHKAYDAYKQLYQGLPTTEEEASLRDFFQLKMALCVQEAGRAEHANRLFKTLSRSRFPIVRVITNYHQSLAEAQKNQYLKAATKAYQTIALIGAVDYNRDWALSLEQDCHFLVAESITRSVLSLCDADKNLPPQLWSSSSYIDPFTNLSEAQLRSFLNSGLERLSKALLGPKVQRLEHGGTMTRWLVICNGASIEELLARFAVNAGLDIHWAYNGAPASEAIKGMVRKRPVSLYLSAATPKQFVTVAAGSVGLVTRMDDERTVKILDPSDYSSLSEHLAMLTQEAVSLWQRLLLTSHSNARTPNIHFALGLLQAQRDHLTDAIAEYKLVASRFPQTSLAPYALLNSSKLKVKLRDYSGAREDLKQLVEQYPDAEFSNQACVHLADVSIKAGLYDEAARLYCKVYNLGLSSESQAASALQAGRCFYEEKDYEIAAKWLTRYISLAADHNNKDLYSACFLLGKTNLARGLPQQACDAFQYALTGQLSKQEYVETLSALVEAHIQQENFVDALNVLENTHPWQLSQKQSVEILLLKASVFRSMGLVDKAIAVLGDRAQYLLDPQLKAKLSFELAKCSIAKGNLELGREDLTEILVLVDPGPLAHEVGCELANVCLKLGQDSQAISICLQLLNSSPAAPMRQKALDLLATAYTREGNYDKAALALLGQPNATKNINSKSSFRDLTLESPTPLNEIQ